jgi:DNA repair protein RadC
MHYQRAESPVKIDGVSAAQHFFAGCIANASPTQENLWVAHVDDEARCIHLTRHQGDEVGAIFPLRQIVADALSHGSAGVILAHNHPSGDPTPSEPDRRSTRRLATAIEAIDCALLDHLIFAGPSCSSMRALGYL